MKCSIKGCPGDYEEEHIIHTVQYHGEVVVIEHVPAEVCSICGDVLMKPETVRGIEDLLREKRPPVKRVPMYEYTISH